MGSSHRTRPPEQLPKTREEAGRPPLDAWLRSARGSGSAGHREPHVCTKQVNCVYTRGRAHPHSHTDTSVHTCTCAHTLVHTRVQAHSRAHTHTHRQAPMGQAQGPGPGERAGPLSSPPALSRTGPGPHRPGLGERGPRMPLQSAGARGSHRAADAGSLLTRRSPRSPAWVPDGLAAGLGPTWPPSPDTACCQMPPRAK